MIEQIKELLGVVGTNKDTLLNTYVEHVKSEIEAYTRREYTPEMDILAVQMVTEKYNRRFNEGIQSASASGVSTSFKDGYSQTVMNQLNAYRKKVQIL